MKWDQVCHGIIEFFFVSVKAAPHECIIRTGLPLTKVRAEKEKRFCSKVAVLSRAIPG